MSNAWGSSWGGSTTSGPSGPEKIIYVQSVTTEVQDIQVLGSVTSYIITSDSGIIDSVVTVLDKLGVSNG